MQQKMHFENAACSAATDSTSEAMWDSTLGATHGAVYGATSLQHTTWGLIRYATHEAAGGAAQVATCNAIFDVTLLAKCEYEASSRLLEARSLYGRVISATHFPDFSNSSNSGV